MCAPTIASLVSVAIPAQAGADAAQRESASPQASADMLRTFLGNDMLLWGCMAMALIALFTVAKVASRRRKAGKASRMARAQADAVHGFLNTVREGHAAARQGMWHYDFATGAQQYSDNLRALICYGGQELAADRQIDTVLAQAGINLAKLARKHFDQTQPYEAAFMLEGEDAPPRQMILRACNFQGGSGAVQRAIAIISEVPDPLQEPVDCECPEASK